MHMHATPGDGMRQNGLIRKSAFLCLLRCEAGMHWVSLRPWLDVGHDS